MANIRKEDFKLSPEHEDLLAKYLQKLKHELRKLEEPDSVQVEIATSILKNIINDNSAEL